jgi:aspartate racemase
VTARVVGVLGGMGPAATWDFCARLSAATPAERDQDHLRVLVDCDPRIPDRNAAVDGGPSPAPRLAERARGLAAAGAELLCMPCNAAHAFAGAVRDATPLPFVDMVEASVAAALRRAPGVRRAALLATRTSYRAGLYAGAFARRGVALLPTPEEDQGALMTAIYAVKAGDASPARAAELRRLGEAAVDRGAQVVVAACTEVPLLLHEHALSVPLVGSSQALAEAVVEAATRT